MSMANPLWGAPRIHGELLKLGIEISQATVAKYMIRRPGSPSPTEGPAMKVTTLGIDLAKSIFRLHGVDARGVAVLRRQLTRKQLLPFLAKLSPCLVGMEAGCGAHFWAREIGKLGHAARLMSPQFS